MKVDVQKLEKSKVKLKVELSVAEYEPYLKNAAQKLSEQTSIPGFRPGKANYELIKKRFGENEIWQTALEEAIRKTLSIALEQEKLETVGSPSVDVVKLAPGNPVVYTCEISLLPTILLGDYSSIAIEKKKIEVDESEIDKTLENLQKMRSTKKPVERQAQKGDEVIIDFSTLLDNVPIDNGSHKDYVLVIGEGVFIPGFEDKIIGMEKGQEKKFKLTFPKEYHQKNLAGQEVDFTVKLNNVQEVILPAVDDAFAQLVGNFKNVADLKKQIKENIEKEQEYKERQRLEEEMIEQLISKVKFDDIPDVLVDSEAKKMVEELKQGLAQQGVTYEDYLNHLKKTESEVLLEFTPQALKRVKSALVVREVSKQQNISVSNEELEHEMEHILEHYGGNPEVEKQIQQQSYKSYLRNVIMSRKAMDYLKSVLIK